MKSSVDPGIVMRETNDYMERQEEETIPEPAAPWVRKVFQPIVVAVLVWCVAWSVAHVIAEMSGAWRPTLFWSIPVFMALVGFNTQRLMRKRLLSGTTGLRSRLIELGVLFLIVKFFSFFDNTIPEIIAEIRGWAQEPVTFFDAQTVVAYFLGVAAWIGASLTARDLDAVHDPTMYLGETGPRKRLMGRYFLGGAVLLIFAGFRRVSLMSILNMENPRVTGLILNVLIYFFTGLVMLGLVQYIHLTTLWRRDKVRVSKGMGTTWIRYLLLLLGLAALVAFLLPTGYTVGILDLAAMVIFIISYVITLIYLLLLWPISMLLSLLMGKPVERAAPPMQRPQFIPEAPAAPSSGSPFWNVVQSFLFWMILIAVVVYLVRSYLRDHPDMLAAVQQLRPIAWLTGLWRAIRHWLRDVSHKVQTTVPDLIKRLRPTRSTSGKEEGRPRGPTARQQLIYHYLTTLDRAKEAGLPRRRTETPYEYRRTLEPHLAESAEAMQGLTESFIVARYSVHNIEPEEVGRQQSNAREVQRALRERTQSEETANQDEAPDT
ncbi:MAG: DUF4129 domain-containing protein [Anaerolineae bacterium]